MIDELQVSNIALIREATLVPSAGLTVLTGETGAGKNRAALGTQAHFGRARGFVDGARGRGTCQRRGAPV